MLPRSLIGLVLSVLLVFSGAALAMPVTGIAKGAESAAPRIVDIAVRSGVPVASTLSDVQAMGEAAFSPFQPQVLYPSDLNHAMWLRLRIASDTALPSNTWVFDCLQPYLDSLHLYAPDGQGGVFTQQAGDQLAMDQWNLRGLYPRLLLPAMAGGEQVVWLKLVHKVPTRVDLSMRTLADSNTHMQHYFLIAGLLIGVVLLMVLIGAYWTIATGDTVNAWYTLFSMSSLATVVVHFGLGGYFLWPHIGVELELSKVLLVLVLLMVVLQLQFCKLLFLPLEPSQLLAHVSNAILCLSGLGLLAYCIVSTNEIRRLIFIAAGLACGICILILVVRALANGHLSAKLWTLAYTPLAVVTVVALGQNLDAWNPIVDIPPYSPMVLLACEVPFLLLVLHLRHKDVHTKEVETSIMAKLDPHTGFLAASQFRQVLERTWEKCHLSGKDAAVVYIKPTRSPSSSLETNQALVRILRTVALPKDTVACVVDNVYAIIMPGTSIGEALSARLSRLVALGMMAAQNGLAAQGLPLRLVCGTLRTSSESSEELHALLLEKLKRTDGWEKRSIRYVVWRARKPSLDLDQLSVLWDDALAKSTAKP